MIRDFREHETRLDRDACVIRVSVSECKMTIGDVSGQADSARMDRRGNHRHVSLLKYRNYQREPNIA